MGKAKIAPKPLKSNLKGKIIKRKLVKQTAETKNKLKKLAAMELKPKPIIETPAPAPEPSPVPVKKRKVTLKMQLRNRPLLEEDEPKRNYVLRQKVSLDHDQVRRGVSALYELLKKTTKKSELFDEEQPLFLQVTCVKIPQTAIRQVRFNLKNSLVTDSDEICLIVPDKGKRREHESTIEYYENILNEKGVTNIKTIMPFHQFKTEYASQYELKRKFLNLYDHFLVDARVNGYVTHLLGSIFFESRKMPTCVKIESKKLKKQVDQALKKTIMKIHSKGDSYAVQIGHTKMSEEEVFENVIQVAEEIDYLFPGGFDNVRSLGIKGSQSISVPVYLTLKNNKTIRVPVCRPTLPKKHVTVKGSLSTYLNTMVTVTPSGEIIVKKHNVKKSKKIPRELLELNEDEVEEASVKDDQEEEPQETEKQEVDASNMEQSDEEEDDLAKEEEMYLHNYENEQDEEEKEEHTISNKRKNPKGKPAKKVKQK